MAIAQHPAPQLGQLTPTGRYTGLSSWLSTVDHKKIGIIYIVSAIVFFVIGGIEALLMRVQLSVPNNTFITPDVYNQLLTMHGTTMIFLGVMPLNVGLGNFIVPLMIGARDMAFPRLNALSVWLFILGGLMLYVSFIVGGAPAMGWFAQAPLSLKPYSPTTGMEYWVLGLTLTGVASIAGALNFIVTILNMRAPGLRLNRMPLFVWMQLITAFILIWAFPALTAAQVMVYFDRNFGTGFFTPAMGGDPLLWQHLFWFFGHPEVYIIILPTFGIISEILPTFARKPIFGYAFVAYSGVAIGFLGFLVWAHHMFATGLGPLINGFFSAASYLIAIPTGVKIFNWIGTLYGGQINYKTPLYYAVGLIAMFICGGITGITLASPPVNLQQTESYYVVAHFHYVLFGGAVFGILGGLYYWFPKITGRMYNERLGKIQFWLTLISFNITFFPMHIVGTEGMPRRYYTYQSGLGWETWNMVETIGAFLLALAFLLLIYNLVASLRNGPPAPADPWDGSTLEWAVPSPPPDYNFERTPTVHSRRPLWDIKYPDLEVSHAPGGKVVKRSDAIRRAKEVMGEVEEETIHLPSPTFQPLVVAVGCTILFFGLLYVSVPAQNGGSIYWLAAIVLGLIMIAYGIVHWAGQAHRDSAGEGAH
jgi:cytochrome c oxidase subunit 1